MAKIDIDKLGKRTGSGYPAPYDAPCLMRMRRALGDAAGLTQFGVNLLELPPGAWSSQRHWHTGEDEFVWVLAGEVVLVTDAGEERLRAGDCAGFARGVKDGHHLINRSSTTTLCLEVGTRSEVDYTAYPDIDMVFDSKVGQYAHRDGSLYPPQR
ncbi:MAG TPA: cupin domain-containing protein [Casimicrobiaceae bacterium]|nr:cupin domain-containing protein [Casimicrobiaceae bacterium]